jgi:hypothetical protein
MEGSDRRRLPFLDSAATEENEEEEYSYTMEVNNTPTLPL